MRINTHLSFNGQCEEAFRLYQRCLGGEITHLQTYGASPMPGIGPEWKDKILHATLTLAASRLTGVDVPPEQYRPPQGFSVQINLSDIDRAETIFTLLADGGVVHLPLQPTFWATRYGITTDRFGTPWEINCGNPA